MQESSLHSDGKQHTLQKQHLIGELARMGRGSHGHAGLPVQSSSPTPLPLVGGRKTALVELKDWNRVVQSHRE